MSSRSVIGCAILSLGALAPGVAHAASESFNDAFTADYYVEAISADLPVAMLLRASPGVSITQFDTMGGTRILDRVTIDFGVAFSAFARVDRTDGGSGVVEDAVLFENVYARASAPSINDPSLVTQTDFNDYFHDYPDLADGVGFTAILDESDFVSNFTEDPADFTPFLGNGNVSVEVNSTFWFKLLDGFSTSGVDASIEGAIRLTYDYHLAGDDTPPGDVIPTPAAAGLGVALFAGALTRRRR